MHSSTWDRSLPRLYSSFPPPWGSGAWGHLCLASGGDKSLLPLGMTGSPSTRSDGVIVFPVQPWPGGLSEVGLISTICRRPTQLLLLEPSHPTENVPTQWRMFPPNGEHSHPMENVPTQQRTFPPNGEPYLCCQHIIQGWHGPASLRASP